MVDLQIWMTAGGSPRFEGTIVHDWLTGMQGGERRLEALCYLSPEADPLTLLHAKGSVSQISERRRIHASAIRVLLFAGHRRRWGLTINKRVHHFAVARLWARWL